MENLHQAQILDLIKYVASIKPFNWPDNYDDFYNKDIESYNIDICIYCKNIYISKYNFAICHLMRYFINYLNEKIDYDYKIKKMEKYESKFLKLLTNLLDFNFLNIKYDLTTFALRFPDGRKIIKYLDKRNLSYLLARINPEIFIFPCIIQERFAYNFYNKQTSLKLAWFSAVIRASYFGPP